MVESEKMQPENNDNLFCRLCFTIISDTNYEIIEQVTKEALETVLPSLNLEEGHVHLMCKECSSKLLPAANFKLAFMGADDVVKSHVEANKMSVIDLKEIYLKINGNIQLTGILKNLRICRLCLQLVTCEFVALSEVDSDIIDTYMPQVNINTTDDPVVCGSCFDSLCTHGGFVKNCLEVQEKYQSGDIELKSKDGGQDNGSSSHHLNDETIKYMIEIKGEYVSLYENSLKRNFVPNRNQLMYKDLSEIQIYKCGICDYETIHKHKLKRHQSTHRDPSEIKTHKCNACDYVTRHREKLKRHQLIHKDPSEIQMFRCNSCDYETKHKHKLRRHQLIHKDPSEIQMHKCDTCDYKTVAMAKLTQHQLEHKDPSEVQMH